MLKVSHGPVLILNGVAVTQFVMICLAEQYQVLPTFGFVALVDAVYVLFIRGRPLSPGRQERRV